MGNVTINKLELACELAEEKLLANFKNDIDIYMEDENGDTYYTEEAQEIFNEYYDEYLDLIERTAK